MSVKLGVTRNADGKGQTIWEQTRWLRVWGCSVSQASQSVRDGTGAGRLHRALPAAIRATAIKVDQDFTRFGPVAFADDAAIF